MKSSNCISKWKSGHPVLGVTLHLTDPALFELTSILGFDVIWVDMEHHSHSTETVSGLMRAARVGKSDLLVRPGNGEFVQMARLLEAGANGIMYPRCSSVEEAKMAVHHVKFPPKGGRGLDASGPDARYGTLPLVDYLKSANEGTFLVVQIEDEMGLNAAQEIAEVDGVDLLFFGPGDFSLQGGFPGDFKDSRYWEALDRLAVSAKNAGKRWGTPAFSSEHAKKLLDMGAMLITYSSDMTLIRKRLTEIMNEFQALGFRFS
ncbi:4-hydroxy-2-oxoheptanedioate aldolase [Cyclobacterium lianum]|uniref:4-hydroxy-2-oxoheptanedioate aldolase n=1 Tax=Cyclobacterium lianum TaxID=388280 RepID=A0A1M7QNX5_9BACT|nr:aldolase/citrate lyase family protein [Cyclobacterium lianum]SHN33091.1 4-hydroxy-2-oxoheptanedioate aldolase [Cyclobacterium lianum]